MAGVAIMVLWSVLLACSPEQEPSVACLQSSAKPADFIDDLDDSCSPYGPHTHELSLPRPFVIVRLSPALRAPACALRA